MGYKDPAIQRQRHREYYEANRDQVRATQASWHQKNPGYQHDWYMRNREQTRAYGYLRRHGLRPEDWASLWEEQRGCCYLCGRSMTVDEAFIDHDHSCCPQMKSCANCRRGLACKRCNTLIALADEDPMRLHRIADALEIAQAAYAIRNLTGAEQLTMFEVS